MMVAGPPGPEIVEIAPKRAVTVGLDGPDMDACGGLGRIISGADEHLPILSGPDQSAMVSGSLERRAFVWLCEAEGEWQGVVYPTGEYQDISDCRVSSPVAEPRTYDGPCQSGWVRARNIELLAG
ncbi:MAG: hypothetical protein KDD98_13330 [Sphingomonadaceae bacterium]|nr:hypothetical protein [Sphingomonadaceae bacterium]